MSQARASSAQWVVDCCLSKSPPDRAAAAATVTVTVTVIRRHQHRHQHRQSPGPTKAVTKKLRSRPVAPRTRRAAAVSSSPHCWPRHRHRRRRRRGRRRPTLRQAPCEAADRGRGSTRDTRRDPRSGAASHPHSSRERRVRTPMPHCPDRIRAASPMPMPMPMRTRTSVQCSSRHRACRRPRRAARSTPGTPDSRPRTRGRRHCEVAPASRCCCCCCWSARSSGTGPNLEHLGGSETRPSVSHRRFETPRLHSFAPRRRRRSCR